MINIHKPAAWEKNTLDELMETEAGQHYVLNQFGAADKVAPEHTFERSGSGDYCAYLIFEDGSLYYVNNAEDVVHFSASDWVLENLTGFSGTKWNDDGEGMPIDDMDREMLMHIFEDEESAKEFFERNGGNVD